MYPFIRLKLALNEARKLPKLGPFDAHINQLRCLPWDIDPWVELNNGRTLTLFDLGRVPWAVRTGVGQILRSQGWGMAVAGASVRYRQRVKMMDRLEMVTKLAGWDERFFYLDQSMWRDGECTSQILVRSAVTSGAGQRGIVPPSELMTVAGHDTTSPALPAWIKAWADADKERPWPPEVASLVSRQEK